MTPLEPRVLDALRANRAAPDEARMRVRARLAAVVPAMRPAAGSEGAFGGGGGGAASLGALGSRTTVIAAFVLGGVTGAALVAAIAGARTPPVVYVDRIASSSVAIATTPVAPPNVDPPDRLPAVNREVDDSRATPARGPQPAIASPASRASRLAAERLLLDEARAGLAQSQPGRALERLELHRTRFPEGTLVEEREAMRVEALVQSGRYDSARAVAAGFHMHSPASLFLTTVNSAIAAIPEVVGSRDADAGTRP